MDIIYIYIALFVFYVNLDMKIILQHKLCSLSHDQLNNKVTLHNCSAGQCKGIKSTLVPSCAQSAVYDSHPTRPRNTHINIKYKDAI
jgi:hypothetical protein